MPNRLALEASPYLRQHAENPVDWLPFGEEALSRARVEDRPIFLSIGYAACHWCHVMAEESFEEPQIARLINESTVPVKVDREERPDLDRVYQTICMLVTGQGGWPLTCWLTPDLRPFYVGTYFPPDDRYGRPGLRRVLEGMRSAWRDSRDEIEEVAKNWAEALSRTEEVPAGLSSDLPERALGGFAAALRRSFDRSCGGFGDAPKFPPHQHLDLLLRHFFQSSDASSLDMALRTLRAMARGGIRDQLGGGFHRYSVDRIWGVPHFEKMLYDNALLAPLYLDAAALSRDKGLEEVGRGILSDLDLTFSVPEGGFISSMDADSPGGEGAYYTFTEEEVKGALPQTGELLCRHFGVLGTPGPVDGRHVLHVAMDDADLASEFHLAQSLVSQRIAEGSRTLLAMRAARPLPSPDTKVLAGWNGLAISAFARAGMRLGEPALVKRATRAAEFVQHALIGPGHELQRRWHDGVAGIPAYLEDYACLARGFLDLHQATQERRWLDAALGLAARAVELFFDQEASAFRLARAGTEGLIVRPFDAEDAATPSPQSVQLEVMLRLVPLGGPPEYPDVAGRVVARRSAALREAHLAYSSLASVSDLLMDGPVELALSPAEGHPEEAAAWLFEVGRFYHPALVAAIIADSDTSPIALGRTAAAPGTRAYVCRQRVCGAPATTLPDTLAQLGLANASTGR